ncbi:MAG TPA: hypothetical protein VFZ21_30980 [Gemmatimonadaceae bacterium]|nr:hypothetical protein [Gemmatimonadaceae bacterium]
MKTHMNQDDSNLMDLARQVRENETTPEEAMRNAYEMGRDSLLLERATRGAMLDAAWTLDRAMRLCKELVVRLGPPEEKGQA